MSKHIAAGDTLTVGDLTDDHLGAVIEVGPVVGIVSRFRLSKMDTRVGYRRLIADGGGIELPDTTTQVTIITPPPVVQPDEPTERGQLIRIEGDVEWQAVVVRPGESKPFLSAVGPLWSWSEVLEAAGVGDRRIIVSDPPRWPDENSVAPEAESPEVSERIASYGWPDDDTHLRSWEWLDRRGHFWRWDDDLDEWRDRLHCLSVERPTHGPWTRGERVE